MTLKHLLCLPALGLASFASGQLVSVSAVDAGWYDSTGFSNPNNTNYAAGQLFDLTRSFFVFDLPVLSGPVSGATLRLFNPNPGYDSPDLTETFALYDVTSDLSQLVAGTGGTAAFDDLGEGAIHGSRQISAMENDTWVTIELGPDFLVFLQTNPSRLALGGALTTLDPLNTSWNELVFAFSDWTAQAPTLELAVAAVPEPSTYAVAGGALLTAMTLWRSRRRAIKPARKAG